MAPLDRATTALTNVSDRLDQADQRLAQGRADLAKLAQDVITALTVAAVVGTLAFLWMALAQLGLFLHAYGVATGRDPLARWHRSRISARRRRSRSPPPEPRLASEP